MAGPGRSLEEVDALVAASVPELRAGGTAALDALFARHGKPPPRVVWSPSEATEMDPRLRQLLAYWRSLAASGLPQWGDFRVETMRPLVGNMAVIDPVEGGRDFRYAVYGTGVADVVNRDYQGETTRQMAARTGTAGPILYLALYVLALERQQPVWSWSTANRWQQVTHWERLVLPLNRGTDGVRFVVGLVPGGRKALETGAAAERDRVIGEDRTPMGRPTKRT